jgi:hypothetical protein
MSFPAPTASTSKRDPTATNSGPVTPVSPSRRLQDQRQRLLDKRDILERLAEGEGIAMHEWDGVVEKCFVCNKIMLEAVFRDHGRDCWHADAGDEGGDESEPHKWGMY